MTQLQRKLVPTRATAGRSVGVTHRASDEMSPQTPTTESTLTTPSGARPDWQIGPGPFGRGDCLSDPRPNGETLILAPPGVPLAPPEPVADIVRWRAARWRPARIVGDPEMLTLDDVILMAPRQRSWILARTREQHEGDNAAGVYAPAQRDRTDAIGLRTPERTLVPWVPWVRPVFDSPVTAASCDARIFARFVGSCAPDEPVKQIAREANRDLKLADFEHRVWLLAADIGVSSVREALVAVLYARAHSRSWRYTKIFARPSKQSSLRREICDVIDRAASPQGLDRSLLARELCDVDVMNELIQILHARSHSARWKCSAPLRLLLAWPRLSGLRRSVFAFRMRIGSWMQSDRVTA
ncbi:MAG: hypothetical protein QOK16_1731 [Solirubrobacteraceae bacterium]|nr:hypothetical protein [Solirubrobacteraceae bacterium]